MTLEVGGRVDRYDLLAELGQGGQGTVWKARDLLNGEICALKLVSIERAPAEDMERVRREARALAKLDHPALCKCNALFEDMKLEVLGLAMEFVDGQSLARTLQDSRFTKAMREAALLQVAAALAHIHEQGLVHRDVKPENVLVTDAFWQAPYVLGGVRLVDFGIVVAEGAEKRLTQPGYVIGTAPYMAPEQMEPELWGGGQPVAATDLFAFGVLAWLLRMGRHPTGLPDTASMGDYAMAYRRAAKDAAWPPAAGSGPWGGILRRCLQLRPSDRYANAAEMLRAAAAGSGGNVASTAPHATPLAGPAAETRRDEPRTPLLSPGPPAIAPTVAQAPTQAALPTVLVQRPRPAQGPSGADDTTLKRVQQARTPAAEPDHRTGRGPAGGRVGVVGILVGGIALAAAALVVLAVVPRAGCARSDSGAAGGSRAPGAWAASPSARQAGISCSDAPDMQYRARLSAADHVNAKGAQLDHAYEVLQQDRIHFNAGNGDQEDEPAPLYSTNVNAPDLVSLAWCFPAPYDSRVERKRVLRGEPLVEVSVHRGKGTLRVIGADCQDWKANIRWLLQYGSERQKALGLRVMSPTSHDDADCAAALASLTQNPDY